MVRKKRHTTTKKKGLMGSSRRNNQMRRGKQKEIIQTVSSVRSYAEPQIWYREMESICCVQRVPRDYGHCHYLYRGREEEMITHNSDDLISVEKGVGKPKILFNSEITSDEAGVEKTITVIHLRSEEGVKEVLNDLKEEGEVQLLLSPYLEERYQDNQGKWIIPMVTMGYRLFS